MVKKKKRSHGTLLKVLHWLPLNFAASKRSQLWLIATLKGLYLPVLHHLSALTNHITVCSSLQKQPKSEGSLLKEIVFVNIGQRLSDCHLFH